MTQIEHGPPREEFGEVFRYYTLAKRAEWQVRDLPWNELPPIPESKGSPERQARRRDIWRSVITQQLQADELAGEMAAQLFSLAPHHEAKLYYTTMVQDESRHTEAWLKLIAMVGGTAERDPHLDKLAKITLEAETLEEKVFQMLEHADKRTKDRLIKAGNRLLPVFVEHELWRPRERAWIGSAMRTADVARLRQEIENGVRMAQSLGLDVSGIELPRLAA